MTKIQIVLTVYLQFLSFFQFIKAFTYTNFYINKYEDCDPQNRSKLSYRLYVKDNFQYIDYDVTLPVELDHRVGVRFIIESTVNERQYTQLLSTYEKNYCLTMQKYGGEFWYDFQRSMQLIPGSCPIPKRRYRVINNKMNFSKIALQTFPFGKMRITLKVMENANQNVVFCVRLLIENKSN
ncbi:hypothetical protein FQR65_LT05334 [Abscondita terminalis]|nr:hypothetical protein FQR65_LT05334 [Abscondita terminalis]